MRLLLDTHAFLWLSQGPQSFSPRVRQLISGPENDVHLSIISVWEIQLKSVRGRIGLRQPLPSIVDSQMRENSIALLPLKLTHLWRLAELPRHHGDPFDRLLLAQAASEGLTVVSRDRKFGAYPVETLW